MRGGASPLSPAPFILQAATAGEVAQAAVPVAPVQAPQPPVAQAQPPVAQAQAPKQSGGAGYSSAATYAQAVAGNEETQFANTFNQGGAFGKFPGNLLPVNGGQNLTNPHGVPTPQQLAMAQSGGARRKGGFLDQAAVPLALLALQQNYRGKRIGRSARRSRKFRASRRSRKSRR
jgi:hypothetical protein